MTRFFIRGATPTHVSVGQSFTGPDGTQYPGNWLTLASAEDLSAIGAVSAPDHDPATHHPPAATAEGWAAPVAKTAGEIAAQAAAELAATREVMTVSPLQARRALRQVGLKVAVDSWLATQPEETQEAWEFATQVRRDDPLIAAAGVALGMTDAQLDGLFQLATSL